MAPAKSGDTVSVHYKGSLDDGTVFDTSEGREPLVFTLGGGEVIPGFEKAVDGLEPGQSSTVTIPPEEAYGPHREEMTLTIGREHLPEDLDPQVGQQLSLTQEDGGAVNVVITAVEEATVTLDANHPLAGKALTFELTLVSIA